LKIDVLLKKVLISGYIQADETPIHTPNEDKKIKDIQGCMGYFNPPSKEYGSGLSS
jgi:hypothetical protein